MADSAEVDDLRQRLQEAEETIQAIRTGAVDAFVVEETGGERVYVMETADRPYRMLVESMQQGALVLAADGTLLFANPRFSAMVQVPPERLIGTPLNRFVSPEDHPRLTALLEHGLRGAAREELCLQPADGHELSADFAVNVLPRNGPALCAVVTDLTGQRQHEALARAQAALARSEAKLRETDRRKDEFLATLAHELRNPLAPLGNAMQILRLRKSTSPEGRWAQDIIDRQIQQLTRLVDELLDLSRITHNQVALQREKLDLASVIEAGVEISQPLIQERGHDLTMTLPDTPVFLYGDLTRLAQVFSNLLNNAARYTDPGGRIQVRAVEDEADVVVSVQDTGVGIPNDLLASIFEMFTQVDSTLQRSQAGLGIGLALVKRLVEMHGGSVEARSDGPGSGSEFSVRLPRLVHGGGTPLAPVRASPPHAQYRILLVDDSRDNADSLALMLRLMGHEVEVAYEGQAALVSGAEFRPDVVLLDLAMPVLDGYETCERIRAEPWGSGVRVIAVTGWGQSEHRRRTTKSGFDGHLVKPVSPTRLMEVLARGAAGA